MQEPQDRSGLVIAGRYQVLERARVSAAPEALRALDLKTNAHVLVFYYPDASLSGVAAQRFLRDAPFVRGVDHARLVRVLDVGVDVDGSAYAVCPWTEGLTLAERVESVGALPFVEAVPVVCDALAALGALHERNLVHRSVTSAEVLIVRDDKGAARGKLLLGGLLGMIINVAGRGVRSQRGRAFGSPHHLAPEQCRGEEATPESDVWAFGIVLYEALSGAVPFDGETPLEVIASVLGDDPPSLEGRVPPAILEVLDGALSKRAAERPPDAEAFCLLLSTAFVSARNAKTPRPMSIKPTPLMMKAPGVTRGQATEFDADDLDALVSSVKAESSPPTSFDLDLELGAPSSPQGPEAHDGGSFDLDPPDAATIGGTSPLSAPPWAPPPSLSPPVLVVSRESQTHTSLVPEVVDRSTAPVMRRKRPINAGVALLGVAAVTGAIGYAGWQFTLANKPPAHVDPVDRPHPPRVRARAADGAVDAAAPSSADDEPGAAHTETQIAAEFGEQLVVGIPHELPGDALPQFVRHVVTAALPDAPRVTGFATCADQHVYLHPGGLVPALRSAPAEARCEGMDIALVPDVDGDGAADVAAVDLRGAAVVVIGSRNFRVLRRVALPGAMALAAGLTRTERGRAEPSVVVFTAADNAPRALVSVGLRSGRVGWRTAFDFVPASPADYGLSVGPDLDGDHLPDVAVGVIHDGHRCVTVLSGATGAAKWRAPRCFENASTQTLSLGPDVNEDGAGDVAVGNAADGHVRVLSGRDATEIRVITPDTPVDGTTFGPGALLVPDVAHDGFADVVIARTQPDASGLEVYSANDLHRVGRRPVLLRNGAIAATLLRVQYAEGFAFAGSRSIIVASPAGVVVLGAAPRPDVRDPTAAP